MAPEFPTAPTPEMPYFQDDKYGRELTRVSPEGNIYGHRRRLQVWEHEVWWDGISWRIVEAVGQALSFEALPTTQRPFGQIWSVRFYDEKNNEYVWREYFWDSSDQTWKPLKWMWIVDSFNDLPRPGLALGEAHKVHELDVPMFWDGEFFRRERHSSLDNDEPERHLPPGFLKWYLSDARVTFVNPTELVLEATEAGSGQIWVAGEYVQAQPSSAVFSNLAALNWDTEDNRLIPEPVQPNAEYWLYLANTKALEFWITGVESLPNWDYRGKLFLSTSMDTNGYLAASGAGANARLVGQVQTDSHGQFLRELNLSLISRGVNFPETFREYSDYQLQFIDQETLQFTLLPGLYGQVYVAGSLEYLGANYEITNKDRLVVWDPASDDKVSLSAPVYKVPK